MSASSDHAQTTGTRDGKKPHVLAGDGHEPAGHGMKKAPPKKGGGHGKAGHGGHGGMPPVAALTLEDLFARSKDDALADAFPKKNVVHPFMDARPVAQDQWASRWAEISSQPRHGKSVAYLHIPFCENHCLFCGFYQNAWRSSQSEVYADAIIGEIAASARLASHQEQPIHAVYFGGGTPTALEADDLGRIIEAVRSHLPLAPDCEITIEGRIYSFPIEKAKACFAAGANRISLGVQTFDTALRRRVGRKVTGEAAQDFLKELIALDQGAIVIDLIFGFPGQSLESWQRDVEIAADLGLDGVDLYALNLIPSSPLAMSINKGKFPAPPKSSELGAYYRLGNEILAGKGWHAISSSHWRRSTRERNLYNLLVKSGASCLAFGSGAGGFLSGYSYRIDGDLASYLERSQAGEKPLGFMMQMPEDRDFLNEAKGQMEVGLLNVQALIGALDDRGMKGKALLMPVFLQWQESGLLELDAQWARLTLAGRFWQVTMTQLLLQWIQQNRPE